jgi:hypothetical protein
MTQRSEAPLSALRARRRRTPWTEELAIEALQVFANRYGRPPHYTELNLRAIINDIPSSQALINLFGSKEQAFIAAGLLLDPSPSSPTDRFYVTRMRREGVDGHAYQSWAILDRAYCHRIVWPGAETGNVERFLAMRKAKALNKKHGPYPVAS